MSYGLKDSRKEQGDEHLVRLAQAGDRDRFEILVERYKKRAYRIAFDFTQDPEEAKDLSQEAFLRAFKGLSSLNGRASFYTWFYRILVNLCLDYRKRRGRISLEPFDEKIHITRDESLQDAMAKRRVRAALGALSPKQRTAFILKHHHELSVKDIAKVMRTAEGTVKAHIHRAVLALRESLSGVLGVL